MAQHKSEKQKKFASKQNSDRKGDRRGPSFPERAFAEFLNQRYRSQPSSSSNRVNQNQNSKRWDRNDPGRPRPTHISTSAPLQIKAEDSPKGESKETEIEVTIKGTIETKAKRPRRITLVPMKMMRTVMTMM